MIANKLMEYATALNALPEEIKNNRVDMMSTDDPHCGTSGCHAGLVSIVADYLPELKASYCEIVQKAGFYDAQHYDYDMWAEALSVYLGFPFNGKYSNGLALVRWARENADIWDNHHGDEMFSSGRAFGQSSAFFPHSVIINHFTAMSDRLNKKETNK